MRLEVLNNVPLNTVIPNFVAIFVFFGTASSFIDRISFSDIEAKRDAILFLFGCSEVHSTWIITSGLANQRAAKALFSCVVYSYFEKGCRKKVHATILKGIVGDFKCTVFQRNLKESYGMPLVYVCEC